MSNSVSIVTNLVAMATNELVSDVEKEGCLTFVISHTPILEAHPVGALVSKISSDRCNLNISTYVVKTPHSVGAGHLQAL